MLEVLKAQQLNIMLILCGITGIISLFVVMSKGMSKKRKESLIIIELGSMLLLIFDRYAYIYRGDVSFTGYWMVRISNFMVFFLTIVTVIGFNEYLADLITNEGGQTKVPRRLMVSRCVLLFGILMLIISQFTGLYYTFDATNHYQRSSGYIICYLIPFIALLIQLSVIIKYGQKLNRGVWVSLILFSVMPFVASVAQLFLYGLSLTNIGLMAMGILLYIFALNDMNTTIEKAHRQEVEYLKEQQSSMNRLFDEMARAFAKAIDDNKSNAKGHSERVAKYARMIAEKVGKDEDECERAYFAALLHDVGKIGIPDELIDKVNLLNNEEEKIYQSHTLTGEKILSEVKEYSYLAEVSHFHHERYDGGGYPDKLKGEEIPELARLVAVADAYDNMTSSNEFRDVTPQFAVREEFVKEGGIRFDPVFSKAMVALIGADSEYRLREIEDETESVWKTEINCTSYRSEISNGIIVSENIKKI
ncbi:MAG: HD domain-containing protein, partial [Lachnospiraceae bacterium]|nr:HD domain-containing protein [Lachnospiraceae bacterium]